MFDLTLITMTFIYLIMLLAMNTFLFILGFIAVAAVSIVTIVLVYATVHHKSAGYWFLATAVNVILVGFYVVTYVYITKRYMIGF